ncbi:MAG: exodeoxyribonuclease VII small subunit [Chromatiales bacterium]|nr:exodeoxyribonuclease VII small subunit [Chromatiales bacterium]MDX9765814.1 exodeoxyribonuclease VII small subunit [Ectothiorhodospiraceae bacterium]
MPRKPQSSPQDFEQALQELEALVQRLEKGELSLEESLKEFERGVALSRSCQEALKQAEQRVRILGADDEEADWQTPGDVEPEA